jgi:hypothetical protein
MSKAAVRRRQNKLLTPELERSAEVPNLQNQNQESESSESPRPLSPGLESFGSPVNPSSAGSSPLFSTSSSDEEWSSGSAAVLGGDEGAEDEGPGPAVPDAILIKIPVLDREDIEAGLRIGHSVAVAKGWGEHWKLKDWQATMLVPAFDAYLQKCQASAEKYIGDFLTRFAGEHKELCALLAVMAVVYIPNLRKTAALRAGVETAGMTTESAASSVN